MSFRGIGPVEFWGFCGATVDGVFGAIAVRCCGVGGALGLRLNAGATGVGAESGFLPAIIPEVGEPGMFGGFRLICTGDFIDRLGAGVGNPMFPAIRLGFPLPVGAADGIPVGGTFVVEAGEVGAPGVEVAWSPFAVTPGMRGVKMLSGAAFGFPLMSSP